MKLEPVQAQDLPEVGLFLHRNLNSAISAQAWAQMAAPPWSVAAPNHGFLLRTEDGVVGVHLAFYSERVLAGRVHRICNLGAWSVLERYRAHGVRLLRALLAQPGYTFTDLSPSGNVVALNERLGFRHLDTATALVPNLPIPGRARGARIVTDPAEIEQVLGGPDLAVFRDHRDTRAAWQFVLQVGAQTCHVVARRDRRRGLPIFASILHVSDQSLFTRHQRSVYRHLLLRHRALITLAEPRVVGCPPRGSRLLRAARPKMYRSDLIGAGDIDYLYSELVCVAW